MSLDPLPAATVIVARPALDRFDVFLVRRPDRTTFMGGAHVFPGGRVDDADLDPAWAEECDGAASILEAVPDDAALARGFAVAAIRETFEEAGVLLARIGSGAIVGTRNTPANVLERARDVVHGQGTSFHAICREHGWRPALDLLVPWSRWITPAVEGRRYDARFFFAHAPTEQQALHDGSETVASTWLAPADALRMHREGALTLVPPTMRTLIELTAAATIDVVPTLERRPADPILPQIFRDGTQLTMAMPGDARFEGASPIRLSPPTRLLQIDGRWHFADRLPAGAGEHGAGGVSGS